MSKPETAPDKHKDWYWFSTDGYKHRADELGVEGKLGTHRVFYLIEGGKMWHASDKPL